MGNKKNTESLDSYLDIAVFILTFALLGYISVYLFYDYKVDDISKAGALGDFFGGILNPSFALIGLFALLTTIRLQNKELRNSRKELKLTRKEAKKSSKALKEQSASIKIQSFENTFFNMLNLHNEITKSLNVKSNAIKVHSSGNYVLIIISGTSKALLSSITSNITSNFKASTDNYEEIYQQILRHIGDDIGHYFRNMYQILKFINEADNIEKKRYVNILRAQLSNSELFVLFLNCASDKGKEKFLPLVTKFEFFEHLSINFNFPESLIDKYINEGLNNNSNIYSVFGDNEQWKQIIDREFAKRESAPEPLS